MKPLKSKRLVLGFLCGLAIVFASYTILTVLFQKTMKGSGEAEEDEILLPDIPSLSLPVSEIFEVKKNTTYIFKVSLSSNITLIGSFKEAAGMCINFYVLNETNLKRWLADRSFSAIISFEGAGKQQENFTFNTGKEQTYYFVFDNREKRFSYEVCQDKYIIFELRTRE